MPSSRWRNTAEISQMKSHLWEATRLERIQPTTCECGKCPPETQKISDRGLRGGGGGEHTSNRRVIPDWTLESTAHTWAPKTVSGWLEAKVHVGNIDRKLTMC